MEHRLLVYSLEYLDIDRGIRAPSEMCRLDPALLGLASARILAYVYAL